MKKLLIISPTHDVVNNLTIQNEVRAKLHEGIFLLNAYFDGYEKLALNVKEMIQNKDLFILSRLIEQMSVADIVYFDNDFEKSESCIMLYEIATKCNVPIFNNLD